MLSAGLFIVFGFAAALVLTALLKRFAKRTFSDLGSGTLLQQLVAKSGLLIAFVILPSIATALLFAEPPERYGWAYGRAAPQLAMGAASGGTAFLVTIAGIALLSRTTVELEPAPPRIIASRLALSLLVWIAGAMIEEACFRGYPFMQLARTWSFWPAALFSSLIFAAIHVDRTANPVCTAAFTALVGLTLCYSVQRLGAIWFAIAFHMSWNFLQSFAFGVRNSGNPPPAFVSCWRFEGPGWITGGSVGPEGSVVAVAAMALTLVLLATLI